MRTSPKYRPRSQTTRQRAQVFCPPCPPRGVVCSSLSHLFAGYAGAGTDAIVDQLGSLTAKVEALERLVNVMSGLLDEAYNTSKARFLCMRVRTVEKGPCGCATCSLTHKLYVGYLCFYEPR